MAGGGTRRKGVSAVDGLGRLMISLSRTDPDGIYRGGPAKRRRRTEAVSGALRTLWGQALAALDGVEPDQRGVGLAAVGSLARGQIGPKSDLDLVLIYERSAISEARIKELADRLWYPLWDSGVDLDHSVRTRAQCESVTDRDLPAAVGWLDVRPVAGDADLITQTATSILRRWRRAARKRLPELIQSIRERQERFGWLPYLNQPDLKEARGGLRDATLTSAMAATWLADRPHGEYDDDIQRLLDARDGLHLVAGRDTNLLLPAYQPRVAAVLGLADPTLPEGGEREADATGALQTLLARLGRHLSFALDSTASRAQNALTP